MERKEKEEKMEGRHNGGRRRSILRGEENNAEGRKVVEGERKVVGENLGRLKLRR